MKINLMRYIDFWVGVPLCFLLSLWNYCLTKFKSQKIQDTPSPKKFLIIKLSEMGAIIVAHPLLANIKRQYPDAEFYFLTFDKSKTVLKLVKNLVKQENVYTIREDSFWNLTMDTLKAIKIIRQHKFDVTLDLEFFSRFTAILTYLSNAPKRVGFFKFHLEGLYRGDLLTHKVPYNPLIHTSKSYLALAQAIKTPGKQTPELAELPEEQNLLIPKISPTEQGRQAVLKKLQSLGYEDNKRIFLMNPGEGTIPLREWPLENFVTLADKILKDKDNIIVLVGIKSENKKDEQLAAALSSKRCINLTDETTIDELLELFYISEGLVINDCGLAHLASLTTVKKFIFFGPESPQIFAPLAENTWIIYSNLFCSPCLSVLNHRNSSCKDNQCLKVITPDHVYDLINQHCTITTTPKKKALDLNHTNK